MDHSFFYSLYQSFEFFFTLSILLSMFCLSSLYSFMSLLQYNKILLKKIQHNSHHLAVATGLAFSSIHASLMMLCHLTMRRTSGKRHYLFIFGLFSEFVLQSCQRCMALLIEIVGIEEIRFVSGPLSQCRPRFTSFLLFTCPVWFVRIFYCSAKGPLTTVEKFERYSFLYTKKTQYHITKVF